MRHNFWDNVKGHRLISSFRSLVYSFKVDRKGFIFSVDAFCDGEFGSTFLEITSARAKMGNNVTFD